MFNTFEAFATRSPNTYIVGRDAVADVPPLATAIRTSFIAMPFIATVDDAPFGVYDEPVTFVYGVEVVL